MNRAEFDRFTDLGLRRLACAIVRDAADSYLDAKKAIKVLDIELSYRQGEDDDEGVKEINHVIGALKREIELIVKFFYSRKFALLAPTLYPDAVIEALDRRAAKYDPSHDYAIWKKRDLKKKQRKARK